MVAETMSRTGSATYSAELIQAQYERLTRKCERADGKDDDNDDHSIKPLGRTTRAVGGKSIEPSTPSRSAAVRFDEASNAINLPTNGAAHGRQEVPKSRSQQQIEHSARMRRVWAIRKAKGTNGFRGGPPKGATASKKAKTAVPATTPNAGSSLDPAVTFQNGHAQKSTPKQTQSTVFEQQIGRNTNHHKQSLAQIVPVAAQVNSGPKHNNPSRKVSAYQDIRQKPAEWT